MMEKRVGSVEELTPRLRQVARCMAAGMSNKEIAVHLGISCHTVRNHAHRLGELLGNDDLERRSMSVRFLVWRLVSEGRPGSAIPATTEQG